MACFREKRKGENPPFFDTTPPKYPLVFFESENTSIIPHFADN